MVATFALKAVKAVKAVKAPEGTDATSLDDYTADAARAEATAALILRPGTSPASNPS